ncbi:MAG: HD domain-containing protein [Desulfobacterales bacterium]|nr:HD domain-containing protein [Desulfobacterales bacterium]
MDKVTLELKQKRFEVIEALLKENNPDTANKLVSMIDEYLVSAFAIKVPNKFQEKIAIIGLDGYGRKDQCIHSDVEIIFIFEEPIPNEAENIIDSIIAPLWDAGFSPRYSSIYKGTLLDFSQIEFEQVISFLYSRFICGFINIFLSCKEPFKNFIKLKSDKIINWIFNKNKERHERFGDATYLLEPNIKESQGCFRDYHSILSIAKIKFNLNEPRDLEYYGYLSHEEFNTLSNAILFLFVVRNHLHNIAGRKLDQLHFDHQLKIASILGFEEEFGQKPVERFLGLLHSNMEYIKHYYLIISDKVLKHETEFSSKDLKINVEGLKIYKNELNFSSLESVLNNPYLLLRIFLESAIYQIPLSHEAKRIVKEFSYLINKENRDSQESVFIFQQILEIIAPKYNVLNEMLNTGILVRIIPEFETLVNRIQYNDYHIYPVDKHSLRTLRIIKLFGTQYDVSGQELCSNLYKELNNKAELFWAGLLHDIGKGASKSDHSTCGATIAANILERKGYDREYINTVTFLIKKHLFLAISATRRDINDEETAVFCGREIKDIKFLKMLYLLTVADSIATGQKAWNSWTASLMKGLFFKTLNMLEHGELSSENSVIVIENKKKEVLSLISDVDEKKKIEKLLNVVTDRYILYTDLEDIIEHINLFFWIMPNNFVFLIKTCEDINLRTVTVCAKDKAGLLSQIAGAFTLNSINILDVQVNTWKNGIALDVFTVTAPLDILYENEKWDKVKQDLSLIIKGEINIYEEIFNNILIKKVGFPITEMKPRKVVIDTKISSFYDIIEVHINDIPGLLFTITNTLHKCALDVKIAKIATNVDQVVDIFYVTNEYGEKFSSNEELDSIKASIEIELNYLENYLKSI